jgi:hypothetical protein
MTYRLAFLALNNVHQIYHIGPIAVAAGQQAGVEAHIYCSTTRGAQLVEELKAQLGGGDLEIHMASTGWERLSARVRGKPFPRVSAIMRRLAPRLRKYDAVVMPDYYGVGLREKGPRPLLVSCRHGAGDRAYGYRDELRRFDLILLSGPKAQERMAAAGILDEARGEIIGYPKFDLLSAARRELGLPRGKPVVVYNPHFAPGLSSWYEHGEAVLELARRRDDYDWVFAPHVNLAREAKLGRALARRFKEVHHVLVDIGSEALVDMSYARIADIYIGDVSSQVYEYLHRTMPCIFFDVSRADPEDPNFLHFRLGQVVRDTRELEAALDRAADSQTRYLPLQEQLFRATFDLQPVRSSVRAVEAILLLLDQTASGAGR